MLPSRMTRLACAILLLLLNHVADSRADETILGVAQNSTRFKTFVKAVEAAGLAETLQGETPLTVFAPTNGAFKKLPKSQLESLLAPTNVETLSSILTYHVVEGEVLSSDLSEGPVTTLLGEDIDVDVKTRRDGSVRAVKLNSFSKVVTADIMASNGVIHAITRVILPPAPPTTIYATIQANPSLSIFLSVLDSSTASAFVDLFVGDEPHTVFAPSNAAFKRLPEETLGTLLLPTSGESLAIVLGYHVVAGNVMSSDLEDGMVATVGGFNLMVDVKKSGAVKLGASNSKVTTADIEATNGVIHIISEVLFPFQV